MPRQTNSERSKKARDRQRQPRRSAATSRRTKSKERVVGDEQEAAEQLFGLGTIGAELPECATILDVSIAELIKLLARCPSAQRAYDSGLAARNVELRKAQLDLIENAPPGQAAKMAKFLGQQRGLWRSSGDDFQSALKLLAGLAHPHSTKDGSS